MFITLYHHFVFNQQTIASTAKVHSLGVDFDSGMNYYEDGTNMFLSETSTSDLTAAGV